MDEPQNKTRQDAYTRVVYAKMGCFVGATDEYLGHLLGDLYVWIGEIQNEQAKRAIAERKRLEIEAESVADEEYEATIKKDLKV